MPDVFISYAREDKPAAKRLVDALESENLSAWWDRDILAGHIYDEIIDRMINESACVVVLWSGRSVRSEWVRSEATVGAQRNALVPALIDDVRVPVAFVLWQTADLRNWDGRRHDPDYVGLVQAIRSKVDRAGPAATRDPIPRPVRPLPGPPDDGDAPDWRAQVVKHTNRSRTLQIMTGASKHIVEFRARATHCMVLVDGKPVARSLDWRDSRDVFEFTVDTSIGPRPGRIVVEVPLWNIRRFRLDIDGRPTYLEGFTGDHPDRPGSDLPGVPAGLLPALRPFHDRAQVHLHPEIPEAMATTARSKARVPPDEPIAVLVDLSVSGTAKDCLFLGREGLHYHHTNGGDVQIDYGALGTAEIAALPQTLLSSKITISPDNVLDITGFQPGAAVIVDLLRSAQSGLATR